MLAATAMLPSMKSVSPSFQSPGPTQYMAVVETTPIARKTPSIFFFIAAKSAIAPRSGAITATITIAIVVAQAKRLVDSASPRSAATTLWK